MALRGLFSCPNLDQSSLGGKGRERETNREREIEKERVFRERGSTFSLKFPAIGPSVSGRTRRKVAPHGKDNTWVPVSGVFDKIHEVGVSSYLLYFLFKCFVDVSVGLRPCTAV